MIDLSVIASIVSPELANVPVSSAICDALRAPVLDEVGDDSRVDVVGTFVQYRRAILVSFLCGQRRPALDEATLVDRCGLRAMH